MLKPSSLLLPAVVCLLSGGAAFAEPPAKPSDALPSGNAAVQRTIPASGNPILQAVPSSAEMLGSAAKPMQAIQANSNPVLQAVPGSAEGLGNAAKPTQTIQASNSPVLQAVPSSAEVLGNAAKPRTMPATSNLVPQGVPNKDAALRPSNAVASAPSADARPNNSVMPDATRKGHWWSRWWSGWWSE